MRHLIQAIGLSTVLIVAAALTVPVYAWDHCGTPQAEDDCEAHGLPGKPTATPVPTATPKPTYPPHKPPSPTATSVPTVPPTTVPTPQDTPVATVAATQTPLPTSTSVPTSVPPTVVVVDLGPPPVTLAEVPAASPPAGDAGHDNRPWYCHYEPSVGFSTPRRSNDLLKDLAVPGNSAIGIDGLCAKPQEPTPSPTFAVPFGFFRPSVIVVVVTPPPTDVPTPTAVPTPLPPPAVEIPQAPAPIEPVGPVVPAPSNVPPTGDPASLMYCDDPDPMWYDIVGYAICP